MKLRLVSFEATAGYLENAPVEFAPGLTCIIGARGTCKSTLVESLRFAFDSDSDRVNLMLAHADASSLDGPSSRGLIRATLEGGDVRVALSREGGDAADLTVERTLDGPPRVFRDGVKEIADRMSILSRIEIYSQGDLQRIAEDGGRRIDLIDRPNRKRVDDLNARRGDAARQLKDLGRELRKVRADLDVRRGELKQLDSIRSELAALQESRPKLPDELSKERDAFQIRRTLLERAREALERREATLHALPTTGHARDSLAQDLRSSEIEEAAILAGSLDNFESSVRAIGEVADKEREADLEGQLAQVETAFEARSAKYYELMREQQQVTESIKREDALKRQLQHLETIEKNAAELSTQCSELLAQRAALRRNIEAASNELYSMRLKQVDEINDTHASVVVLTLHQGTRSPAYRQLVASLLQGSRLRHQDDVAGELAEQVQPSDFVDIVEAGDSQRLADLLDRDLGQMARLVAFLIDSPLLYDLEAVIFDDSLEITMYVDDVPKPISQLSKGQMATALLPLILRPADHPLVFDQPEDDLDNAFIYDSLVNQIRSLKQQRQLVFVTHNANIPVLGDAEQVVVMSMNTPRRAAPPMQGTVDAAKQSILRLLEGGVEAFRLRGQRYAELLDTEAAADDPEGS